MNDLIEIYRRIEYLRNNGLKMKEIADYVDMAPSVLSALYSSVLPTYVTSLKQGHSEEDSLDLALAQVNNVSKKRLLGNLASIKELLFSLEPAHGEAKTNPFMEMMTAEMQRSVQEVYNYSGSYLSYSLSSSCQCLKVEPYLIEASEDNTYVKVTHMSAYNTTHRGVGLFNNHQNGYIFFNERESPQMALFSIYLQLPMYDFPPFLKGLYLSLDYNRNPIARRILFVKQGDSADMEEFLELKGELVPLDKLTELQKKTYDYTCQEGDCIRTCMVPSPQLNENDLEREKDFVFMIRTLETACNNNISHPSLLHNLFFFLDILYGCILSQSFEHSISFELTPIDNSKGFFNPREGEIWVRTLRMNQIATSHSLIREEYFGVIP